MRNKRNKTCSAGKPEAYVERVNRAIDFILQHLDQAPKLDEVARVACFSPFHFHRIFRLLMGESINEFVKRARLERAVTMMSQKDWAARRRSLTEIAVACGFGSSSDFTRCFKQQYGVAPSRFDMEAFRRARREEWQIVAAGEQHRHLLDGLKPGANPDGFEARLRPLPPRQVAYLRVQNPFGSAGAVVRATERLVSWAEARGLAGGQWLGYMWDDPEIVAHADCRYDVGVEVPAGTMRDEEVGMINFPEIRVAEVEVRGGIDLEMRALDWMYGTWLPQSSFVPAEQPCFEAWVGRPFAHGTERFELRLQVAVEKS